MSDEYCPACIRYKICTSEYREESGYCDSYKSKENVMSEKIQMTKKQAGEIYDVIVKTETIESCIKIEAYERSKEESIKRLEVAGYIIESELQQKVEEAEEMPKRVDVYESRFLINDYEERQKAITAFVNSGYMVKTVKMKKSDKFKYLNNDYDYFIIIYDTSKNTRRNLNE